jgi:hypothetical protein
MQSSMAYRCPRAVEQLRYLGSRESDSNINNGIKMTADEEPKNFYVYTLTLREPERIACQSESSGFC